MAQEKMTDQLAKVRGDFIEAVYPKIFGDEEMGDPAATMTPEDLTGILANYEGHLAISGLLRNEEE